MPGFPCILFEFQVLSFLFVSFHPSPVRSHSCSPGARLSVSLRRSPLFPLSFVCFRFRFRLLGLLFLPFLNFPVSPHSGFSGSAVFAFATSAPSFVLSGFPYISSDDSALGFPFVSFHPSQLHFPRLFRWCSPFGLPPAFSLAFAFFRLHQL